MSPKLSGVFYNPSEYARFDNAALSDIILSELNYQVNVNSKITYNMSGDPGIKCNILSANIEHYVIPKFDFDTEYLQSAVFEANKEEVTPADTSDPNNIIPATYGWDPTYNGPKYEDDVYKKYIKIKNVSNTVKIETYKGSYRRWRFSS